LLHEPDKLALQSKPAQALYIEDHRPIPFANQGDTRSMSTFAALDNVVHSDLKVNDQYGSTFANNVNQALVFPTEFQSLQREYPIFFRQTHDNTFYAVVILGLDKDENLFVEDHQWNARYIPATHMKGPFALSLAKAGPDDTAPEAVINIDLDDPRVNSDQGEPLFLAHGGHSPYLQEMLKVLQRIHVGTRVVDEFFMHLASFNLIEPVTVEVNFSETMSYTVPDVFTISKTRMQQLNGDELQKLNDLGLLEHCFSVMASAGNMAHLVDMKALHTKTIA